MRSMLSPWLAQSSWQESTRVLCPPCSERSLLSPPPVTWWEASSSPIECSKCSSPAETRNHDLIRNYRYNHRDYVSCRHGSVYSLAQVDELPRNRTARMLGGRSRHAARRCR